VSQAHLAIVRQGKARPFDPRSLAANVARYEGKQITITISGGEKTRDQMGYYRSTVLPQFAEQYGDDDIAAVHYVLKDMFLRKIATHNKLTGEMVYSVPSLADVSMEEMSEFLDKVLRRAALEGYTISEPRGKA